MKRILPLALSVIILFGLVVWQGGWAEGEPWQPVPGPYGGSVAALVLSPNYPVDHTVFAGLRGQGVYRTTDSGTTWHRVSPDGWVIVSLAISPAFASDRTLFATHGLWTTGYRVYRSTDEGDSWQDVTPAWTGLPSTPHLAISPDFANDRTVYVVGGLQTFVSTDGGDTFVPTTGWLAFNDVTKLAFSPAYATDRTLFALVRNVGLYTSPDGGITWISTNLLGRLSTFAVSPDYANSRMLLAVSEIDGQLYLSPDGGNTWSPGTLTLGVGGEHTLLFSPTFGPGDRVILAASSTDPGIYRSEDGGVTWLPAGWYDPANAYVGGFIGGSVYALALAPNGSWDAAAFAGTSSGIYYSLDRGVHWWQGRSRLARLTIRALAVAPGDPSILLAGTSFFEHLRFDTGTPGEYDGNLQLSTDGGRTWRHVSRRLDQVQNVAFSPGFATDGTAFAAAGTLGQHGYADGGVYRSTNGGQDWAEVLSDRLCRALALSPNFAVDHTLWVSEFTYSSALGLYISTDGGDTWTPLAPTVHAQVLAPSPNYAVDQTLFAGTFDDGLQRSTNGGSDWARLLTKPVTALAVSPAYGASRTVYAGVKEISGAPGELYRSTDGGDTWLRLETGIPPAVGDDLLTFSTLAFAADGSVLAGVYFGREGASGAAYRSTDGGETWQAVGSGLDAYNVFVLAGVPSGSMTFYAGTDGGLWQLEVPQGGPAEAGTWASSGPRGGRAQALAVSPDLASDGVAFTGEWRDEKGGGQSGLGIFKSIDEGQTWQRSASGTETVAYSSAVHAFAFSPAFASDQTVFAATWGGLFRSTDGGQTWPWVSRLYSGPFGSISAVAVAPDYPDSGHVLAASGWGGLYMSRDGGINWTAYYTVPASSAVAYSPDFANDGVAFAGGWNGLYKTSDGGTSWTEVLTATGVSALAISPEFEVNGTLFVGADALYISHDGGTSWISITLPTGPYLINALVISPDFADQTLFAGIPAGLYRSTDGGLSWEAVASYPGLPVRSLAISPGWPAHPVLLVGTDQGVFRTTDGGATWALSQGPTPLSTEPIALSADESLLVTGAYRHGVYGSIDGGGSWVPLGLQEMGYYRIADVALSPAYATDGTMFAALDSTVTIGGMVRRTTDGGATWDLVYSTDYVGALAVSPQYASDQTVYVTGSSSRVLKSENGGDTWSLVGNWPPGVSSPVRWVALPRNYPADGTLFAAGYGFWRLPAGATTWEPAASGLTKDKYVLSLAVSPSYAADETLLATASWQSGPGGELYYGVFYSTDGGVNWELGNIGLPDTVLRYVTFSPYYVFDHTAYVTSKDQLYRSLSGGLSWTAVGAPPEASLYDLVVNSQGDMYVATDSGVWHYSTPAQDILVNGGFEADSGWELPQTPRPAGYSGHVAYDGARSMRIGTDNGTNVRAYSSARQVVTIPADAISATLHCSIYPVSGESTKIALTQTFPEGMIVDDMLSSGAAIVDAQYLLLLGPSGSPNLKTLFYQLSNEQRWQHFTFDLTPYAGQTFMLYFGVSNDGAGGQTGMYVDNVSLVIRRPVSPHVMYQQALPLIQRGE